jgi:tetratricopeptide (TPR) repeat protein
MHRPSRADVVAAAAERYLPLARLANIRVPPESLPADIDARQRAVALALDGELAAARVLFEWGGTPLDRKYLADLALHDGEHERAVELYLATLADAPDRRIVGWLLDQLADSPRGGPSSARARRLVRDHFAAPEAREQARGVLDAAIHDSPRRAEPWRELAALLCLGGATAEADQCAARAEALAAAAVRRERAMGRVLSAAVYHFADAAKGLVHEVWVTRRRVAPGEGGQLEEVFGNLTPEFGQAVRNIFVSVREYTLAKLPHLAGELASFNYAFKVTKEDEPSGGVSGGLPTALALISAFIDRPVPQDIAASGALVADAHDVLVVARVGEAEFKVRGAYNRNLRAVLLPEGSRADVERSHHVPRAICDELVVFVEDLDAAVSFVFGDDVWVR